MKCVPLKNPIYHYEQYIYIYTYFRVGPVYLLQELPLVILFLVSVASIGLLLHTVMSHFKRTKHLKQTRTFGMIPNKVRATEYKLMTTCTKIVMVFILCYGPRMVYGFLYFLEKFFEVDLGIVSFQKDTCFGRWYVKHLVYIFPVTINAVVNPVLYGNIGLTKCFSEIRVNIRHGIVLRVRNGTQNQSTWIACENNS